MDALHFGDPAMPGRPKQEITLLKASLRGDSAAFGVIVGDYQSLVCAITYSGTRNVETSEELAQEVFLKAWKSLGQLKDPGRFRAWLCSIARSTVQNWFRSQKRDVVSQAAPLDTAAGNASAHSGPEEAAMIREQHAVVDHALAEIPEGLREPLVLFYRQDQSVRQVARQLGLSEPATRQRIARGRSMLREHVAAMVETTLERTKPGEAFKTAVMAAIAATVVKAGATATAAGSQAASSGAAGVVAGVGAKLAVLAAGMAIVAGGIVAYRQFHKPEPPAAEQISNIAHEPQGSAVQEDSGPAAEGRAAATPTATARPTSSDGMPEPLTADTEVTGGREMVSDTRPVTTSAEIRQKISEFRPSGVLSGIITDAETGEPVPDAIVTTSQRRRYTTQTDSSGFYAFDEVHAAGNFDMAVEAATHVGFSQQSARLALYLSNDTQTVRHSQLPKACMVDVWVVDVNGVGIGDTMVVGTSLVDDFGRAVGHFADRRTDPNGYVLLGGFPPADAEYMITAWHSVETGFEQRGNVRHRRSERDYALGKTILQLTDPNVIPEVQIVLEDGQDVRGYAEYADGVAAGGIKLVARPGWWHSTYALDGAETADDGTFTFKHITPGTYDIWRYGPW
jgi:RNA polymerase sigma factor (sigma-70 family)